MPITPATAREIIPGDTLFDDATASAVRGLELRGGIRGAVWYLYYRTRDGQRRRPKLGTFPEISLSTARDIARDLLERVARGEDPSEDWQRSRAEPTMNDLCNSYLDFVEKTKAASSLKEDRRQIESTVRKGLGDAKVARVTLTDIDAFLDAVEARRWISKDRKGPSHRSTAPGATNRVRALLHRMFTLAETRFGMRPQNTNPVRGSIKRRERKRRRQASPAELAALAKALAALEPVYPRQCAAIHVMFASGARVGEIMRATRAHLSGDVITYSAGEHKTGGTIGDKDIVLPPRALAIIRRLPPDPSGLIFGTGDYRLCWERAREMAGCPDLQLRDARRTFASIAVRKHGVSLDQVGEVFAHTSAATTAGYAWLLQDDKRDIVQKVNASLDEFMKEKPEDDT